jgi:hypothetical protein
MATKAGLEIRAHHAFDTHRHWHKVFTGSQERISKIASADSETEVEGVLVAAVAAAAEEPRSRRRRLGTGGINHSGGSDAMAVHGFDQESIHGRDVLKFPATLRIVIVYVGTQIDWGWHFP